MRYWCNSAFLRSTCSVQSTDKFGHQGYNSAKIRFQSFLWEAMVSSSGMGWDVHSWMLSIQHFLSWPQYYPTSNFPCSMALERLSWCVTSPNHVSFHLLTVARRGSCGPTMKSILLRTKAFCFVFQIGHAQKFPQALGLESLDPFLRVSKHSPCTTAIKDGDDKVETKQREHVPNNKICYSTLFMCNK